MRKGALSLVIAMSLILVGLVCILPASMTAEGRPVFGTDSTPTSGTTGESFTFDISVTDATAVYVEYWFGTGSTTNRSMSGSDPYTHTISIPGNSVETLHYLFSASNATGAWTTTAQKDVTITDNDKPGLSSYSTDDATTGDAYTFEIGVNDNVDGTQVSAVHVVYSAVPWATDQNLSLSYNGVDMRWTGGITVNLNSISPITYNITASDAAGNWMFMSGYRIDVIDNDMPSITTDQTDGGGTTGDDHNFTADLDDNIEVESAYLNYSYPNGPSYTMISMTEGAPGNWYVWQTLEHTLSPVTYNFIVVDTSDNMFYGSNQTITMTDNDVPEIFSDMSPSSAVAGQDDYPFRVMVTDNIAVQTVEVTYSFDYAPTEITETMTKLSGNIFYNLVDLQPLSGTMYYSFRAVDSSMNEYTLDMGFEVDIIDNTIPDLGEPVYSMTATTGDTYSVSIDVTDDVEVNTVRMYYYFGMDMPETIPYLDGAVSGTTYNFDLDIPDSLDMLHFWIEAMDLVENTAMTGVMDIEVLDNDDPVIDLLLSDMDAATGEEFMFKINASDNIAVDHVDVTYQITGMEEMTMPLMEMEGSYHYTMTLPNDNDGDLVYHFTVHDTSGNMVQSEEITVDIIDDEPPMIGIDAPMSADQHELVFISASPSSDNVGIVSYEWDIMGEPLSGMEINYTFDDAGVYTITLLISDGVNPAVEMSKNITIIDADIPEIILDAPDEMGNHQMLVANASGSTDNIGIVSYDWVLVLPDNSQVEGTGPIFEHDIEGALGEMTLDLSVSDAVGNEATLTHIIVSKDLLAPTAVAPEDAETYEGQTLTFTDMGSTDNIGVVDWVWTVADEVFVGKDLFYFFEDSGEFNISLTVYDSAGNNDTVHFLVNVLEKGEEFDTDSDGMPDTWEETYGLDKESDDRSRDPDEDKLTNYQEYLIGTDPTDPDTDGDGLPDGYENRYEGLDPLTPGDDTEDPDGDGDTNLEEYLEGSTVRDPTKADADEEEEDNTTLFLVIAIIVALLILLVMAGVIVLFGKGKDVEEDFPESEYPHLYK